MKTAFLIAFFAVLSASSQGCMPYFVRPVTVHVRDAETKEPIENAEIRSQYLTMFDYSVLLVPDRLASKTSNPMGESVFWIDPNHDHLVMSVGKEGYQPARFQRESLSRSLTPRKWYQWKNDLYTIPEATLELVVPDGYHGPIVLQFADEDHPPKVRGQRHFTYVVPKNGVVDIQETTLLSGNDRQKDILTLRFQNDKQIHTLNSVKDRHGKIIDPDGPVFHEIHFGWKENSKVFCVGTYSDAFDMQKKLKERFHIWEESGQHTRFDVLKELQFR